MPEAEVGAGLPEGDGYGAHYFLGCCLVEDEIWNEGEFEFRII